MIRQRLLAVATVICSVIGLNLAPPAAAADPGPAASVAACQPESRAFQYVYVASSGHLAAKHYECAGEHNVNSLGYIIQTRGWSGTVYFSEGGALNFCPGSDLFLNRRVRLIYLTTVCLSEAQAPKRRLSAGPTADAGYGVSVAAGCQAARAALQYVFVSKSGHLDTRHYECSGEHGVNSIGYIIQTRGWSGYFEYTSGWQENFCDNEDKFVYQRITKIFMHRSRPPRCN